VLIFHHLEEFRAWRRALSPATQVALVPTMGALHDGHCRLIADACLSATEVVVSIFVNKIQFTQQSDFDKYPRTLDSDLDLARRAGATVVVAPSDDEFAPYLASEPLIADSMGSLWEGADRPGHFDGVLTVVNQLFELVRPNRARFGEKDRQQLAIITEWAGKAWPDVVIDKGSTVRDSDGLALSSRNARLTASSRNEALSINRALAQVVATFSSGERSGSVLEATGRALVSSKLECHYFAVVDGRTLQRVERATPSSIALVAASIDGVRLVDNRELSN
jgi:pantoate--beta-alanine ligase